MLHTKFRGNRPAGSGEGDFYHIWAWQPSWSCDQHHVIRFSFLVPESFHKKFGSDRQSSSEKKSGLNFCMYTTLCQSQEMTLTFNTHKTSYIQLDDCSY